MSSSPVDRPTMFDSPENKDSAPLYNSTDGFLPLGFSTPQHRNAGQNSQPRNYYSAQPKYMLPRQRGYQQQRGRNNHQPYTTYGGGGSKNSSNEEASSIGPMERSNFGNRQWKGQNFHKRNHQRRNRFGLEHQQNKGNNSYNISDYFHPSMLEDPWVHFMQKNEQEKVDEADSSDAGGGVGGGGSSGGGGGGSED